MSASPTVTTPTKAAFNHINQLFAELCGLGKMTLDKAIEIGGLLAEQKEALPHGQFLRHVREDLDFDVRTSQRYMRLWKKREELKSDSVTLLNDAYRVLAAPKPVSDSADPHPVISDISDTAQTPSDNQYFDASGNLTEEAWRDVSPVVSGLMRLWGTATEIDQITFLSWIEHQPQKSRKQVSTRAALTKRKLDLAREIA